MEPMQKKQDYSFGVSRPGAADSSVSKDYANGATELAPVSVGGDTSKMADDVAHKYTDQFVLGQGLDSALGEMGGKGQKNLFKRYLALRLYGLPENYANEPGEDGNRYVDPAKAYDYVKKQIDEFGGFKDPEAATHEVLNAAVHNAYLFGVKEDPKQWIRTRMELHGSENPMAQAMPNTYYQDPKAGALTTAANAVQDLGSSPVRMVQAVLDQFGLGENSGGSTAPTWAQDDGAELAQNLSVALLSGAAAEGALSKSAATWIPKLANTLATKRNGAYAAKVLNRLKIILGEKAAIPRNELAPAIEQLEAASRAAALGKKAEKVAEKSFTAPTSAFAGRAIAADLPANLQSAEYNTQEQAGGDNTAEALRNIAIGAFGAGVGAAALKKSADPRRLALHSMTESYAGQVIPASRGLSTYSTQQAARQVEEFLGAIPRVFGQLERADRARLLANTEDLDLTLGPVKEKIGEYFEPLIAEARKKDDNLAKALEEQKANVFSRLDEKASAALSVEKPTIPEPKYESEVMVAHDRKAGVLKRNAERKKQYEAALAKADADYAKAVADAEAERKLKAIDIGVVASTKSKEGANLTADQLTHNRLSTAKQTAALLRRYMGNELMTGYMDESRDIYGRLGEAKAMAEGFAKGKNSPGLGVDVAEEQANAMSRGLSSGTQAFRGEQIKAEEIKDHLESILAETKGAIPDADWKQLNNEMKKIDWDELKRFDNMAQNVANSSKFRHFINDATKPKTDKINPNWDSLSRIDKILRTKYFMPQSSQGQAAYGLGATLRTEGDNLTDRTRQNKPVDVEEPGLGAPKK